MRAREFVMKDGYSFHLDWDSLNDTYETFYQAYSNIFKTIGLNFIPVQADAGAIGDAKNKTHEFQVIADAGEDTLAICPSCSYAANVEKAVGKKKRNSDISALKAKGEFSLEEVKEKWKLFYEHGQAEELIGDLRATFEDRFERSKEILKNLSFHVTPKMTTIEQVSTYLNISSSETIKTLVYEGVYQNKSKMIFVFLEGDDDVNEIALKNTTGVDHLRPATEEMLRNSKLPVGFIGPFFYLNRQIQDCVFIFDSAIRMDIPYIVGGNSRDLHIGGLQFKDVLGGIISILESDSSQGVNGVKKKSFEVLTEQTVRNVKNGDQCSQCSGDLKITKGIEVGHIFQLGDKYTKSMNATITNQNGIAAIPLMGCYGIGVTRVVGATIEQHHDDKGIIWPKAIAPYLIHIVRLGKDAGFLNLCDEVYHTLKSSFTDDVVYDDRDLGLGFKLKDAELLGCPIIVVLGERDYESSKMIEVRIRRTGETVKCATDELLETIQAFLKGEKVL